MNALASTFDLAPALVVLPGPRAAAADAARAEAIRTPDARDLVLPLLAALPLCVLGAAYPAWRAVRMMPAEALRRL